MQLNRAKNWPTQNVRECWKAIFADRPGFSCMSTWTGSEALIGRSSWECNDTDGCRWEPSLSRSCANPHNSSRIPVVVFVWDHATSHETYFAMIASVTHRWLGPYRFPVYGDSASTLAISIASAMGDIRTLGTIRTYFYGNTPQYDVAILLNSSSARHFLLAIVKEDTQAFVQMCFVGIISFAILSQRPSYPDIGLSSFFDPTWDSRDYWLRAREIASNNETT